MIDHLIHHLIHCGLLQVIELQNIYLKYLTSIHHYLNLYFLYCVNYCLLVYLTII